MVTTRRGGFTLVELLVVVAIIAVLVMMLMPVFPAARQNAQRVQCASNLHQIGLALTNYDLTYKHLPGGTGGAAAYVYLSGAIRAQAPEQQKLNDGQHEVVFLKAIAGSPWHRDLLAAKCCTAGIFGCPSDRTDAPEAAANPNVNDANALLLSYALNVNYAGAPMFKAKSSYILAGEGVYAPGLDSPLVGPSRLDNLSLHRHRLMSNFLFFDTHVELLTYAQASGNQGENWGTDQRKKPEGGTGDVIFWSTTDSGGQMGISRDVVRARVDTVNPAPQPTAPEQSVPVPTQE